MPGPAGAGPAAARAPVRLSGYRRLLEDLREAEASAGEVFVAADFRALSRARAVGLGERLSGRRPSAGIRACRLGGSAGAAGDRRGGSLPARVGGRGALLGRDRARPPSGPGATALGWVAVLAGGGLRGRAAPVPGSPARGDPWWLATSGGWIQCVAGSVRGWLQWWQLRLSAAGWLSGRIELPWFRPRRFPATAAVGRCRIGRVHHRYPGAAEMPQHRQEQAERHQQQDPGEDGDGRRGRFAGDMRAGRVQPRRPRPPRPAGPAWSARSRRDTTSLPARSDRTAAQDTTSIASKITGKMRAMLADTPADRAIL